MKSFIYWLARKKSIRDAVNEQTVISLSGNGQIFLRVPMSTLEADKLFFNNMGPFDFNGPVKINIEVTYEIRAHWFA